MPNERASFGRHGDFSIDQRKVTLLNLMVLSLGLAKFVPACCAELDFGFADLSLFDLTFAREI